MNVGTTPVIFLRGIGHAPHSAFAIPVGIQSKVDAPCRQQESKHLGGGAHGLIPVIIPLTFNRLIEISRIQPFLGIIDPVHDLRIYLNRSLTSSHPRSGDAVAIQSEGIRIGGKRKVTLRLQFFCSSLQSIPVLNLFAYCYGIISTENILGNIAAIHQQAWAALPGRTALYAILVRSSGLGKLILVSQISCRINAQILQRHSYICIRIGVFEHIIGFRKENIHLIIVCSRCLIQQCLVQLLLIHTILIGIDDPVDLRSILELGNSTIRRSTFYFRVDGLQTGTEFIVPAIDIDDRTFRRSTVAYSTAGCTCSGAATGQHTGTNYSCCQQRNYSFVHAKNLLFF